MPEFELNFPAGIQAAVRYLLDKDAGIVRDADGNIIENPTYEDVLTDRATPKDVKNDGKEKDK
jgi:hypothetical protein